MKLDIAGHDMPPDAAAEFSRLYASGDEEGAVDVAEAALVAGARFTPPLESVWWLVSEFARRRRFRLARSLMEEARVRGYAGWRAHYLTGILLAVSRQFDEAAKELRRAMKFAPESAGSDIALKLGRVLILAGDGGAALDIYRRHSSLSSSSREVARAATLAIEMNECGPARRWLVQANRRLGQTAQRMGLLAQISYLEGQWSSAATLAGRALEQDPTNSDIARLFALASYRSGDSLQALRAIEQNMNTGGAGWPEGEIVRSRILLENDRYADAIAQLERIEGNSSVEKERLALLVRTYEASGDIERAGQEQAHARESFPDDTEFHRPLSRQGRIERGSDLEVDMILRRGTTAFRSSWTPEELRQRGNVFEALSRLSHSVRTLMLRETMARFGRYELGYLWTIIEPAAHVIVLTIIFAYIRLRHEDAMSLPLFITTGVIPYFLYSKTYGELSNALRQSKPLLKHPRIQPMDIFFARSGLEFMNQSFVFVLFLFVIYLFVEPLSVANPLGVLINMFGLWIFGIGMGLAVGSFVTFAESVQNVMGVVNRFLYLTSGIFFTLDRAPESVAKYLSYNPLLHFVEGVRGNFTPLMGGDRVNIWYGFGCAFAVLAIGLLADRAYRDRVLNR
ncbi:MAG: ABC transporter permease [Parvibaculum sp.]